MDGRAVQGEGPSGARGRNHSVASHESEAGSRKAIAGAGLARSSITCHPPNGARLPLRRSQTGSSDPTKITWSSLGPSAARRYDPGRLPAVVRTLAAEFQMISVLPVPPPWL